LGILDHELSSGCVKDKLNPKIVFGGSGINELITHCRQRSRHEKGVNLALLVGILMLVSSFGVILATSSFDEAQGTLPVSTKTYVSHPRVDIVSDADFAAKASSDGWTGDGSASSPYIIQGYDIDATGGGSAIAIGNTTVHFRITGCYLHDATMSGAIIFNATAGTVDNSTCSFNALDGITISLSTGIVLHNNTCASNNYGVRLLDSSQIDIVSGRATTNVIGMLLESSDNVTMTDCTVSGNSGTGIELVVSDNNTITDCHTLYNVGDGIAMEGSNNVVNGAECVGNGGSGIQATGESITIDHCVCTNNGPKTEGILLSGVNNSIVSNNSCKGHRAVFQPGCGIVLSHSSNNSIVDNLCSGNYGHGMTLSDSDENLIRNNTLTSNLFWNDGSFHPGNGLGLAASNYNMVDSNNCSDNRGRGIFVWYSSGGSFTNNTCVRNGADGMIASASSVISHNTIEANGNLGIALNDDNNTVIENSLANNQGGISISSKDNTLSGNEIVGDGIDFQTYGLSQQCWESNYIDTSNTANGKPIYYLSGVLGGNVPEGAGQIILANCSGVVIENQTISRVGVEIQVAYSSGIVVRNCSLSLGSWGVYLYRTYNSQIETNVIFDHSSFGVSIVEGTGNRVWNNTFVRNNGAWDIYDSGHIQAMSDAGNFWNSSDKGNYWGDWQTPDGNYDGIVDFPYLIWGVPHINDNYPLTTQTVIVPELQSFQILGATFGLISLILVFCENHRRKHKS
jgi:parallel beta-helix repeat protein